MMMDLAPWKQLEIATGIILRGRGGINWGWLGEHRTESREKKNADLDSLLWPFFLKHSRLKGQHLQSYDQKYLFSFQLSKYIKRRDVRKEKIFTLKYLWWWSQLWSRDEPGVLFPDLKMTITWPWVEHFPAPERHLIFICALISSGLDMNKDSLNIPQPLWHFLQFS